MLLFLDIDGVMVPAKSWKSPDLHQDGFPMFSSNAIDTLKHIVSEDCTVMLTTSHKSTYTIEQWKEIFNNRGIHINNLKSLPDNVSSLSRKDEIMAWLSTNDIKEQFIIIDDDKSLNDLPNLLKKKLVQTYSHIGLTKEHLEVIESIKAKV